MPDDARPCRAAVSALSEALGNLFRHDQTTYWTEPAADAVIDDLRAAGYEIVPADWAKEASANEVRDSVLREFADAKPDRMAVEIPRWMVNALLRSGMPTFGMAWEEFTRLLRETEEAQREA